MRDDVHGLHTRCVVRSRKRYDGLEQPVKKGNYRVPACAYCHMQDGTTTHSSTGTIYSDMGMFEVDRGSPKHKAKRDAWIKKCQDCHSPRFAADKLKAMDDGIRLSFTKWRSGRSYRWLLPGWRC